MTDLLSSLSSWGTVLTCGCFGLFYALSRRVRQAWCNPLLLGSITIGALLLILKIPYAGYRDTSGLLSGLMVPATVSLAIPLYEQWELLKKHWAGILSGIAAGVATSLLCVTLMSLAFRLDRRIAVSMLPKSVTSAIGGDIAGELGGIPSLAIVLIILTGILGNMAAPFLCRVFRLEHPVSRGIAIGTSSHAIGSARALEMGPQEGAMSALAITAAGILTAVLAPLAARLLI